jgi:enoyl-CoA hydratase/carnithine racemase
VSAELQIDGGVACLVLRRPEALNALNEAMMAALEEALARVAKDASARVLLLVGMGRAFCAGSDLKELAGVSRARAEELVRREAALCRSLEALSVPSVAAIHGYALGGGAALALSCDIRVAAAGAMLGFPEVVLGWNPPWAMARLARAIGESAALELLVTGRRVGAAEALRMGLVTRVVPDRDLTAECSRLATTIAAHPAAAVRAVKHSLRAGAGLPLAEADEIETRCFLDCFDTPQARSGIERFTQRRDQER